MMIDQTVDVDALVERNDISVSAYAHPAEWAHALAVACGQYDETARRYRGALGRLAATVASMTQRRDGNVGWSARCARYGRTVELIGSSDGGCWTHRAWWARGVVEIGVDDYLEVRTAPVDGEIVATGTDDPAATRFVGRVLAPVVERCYREFEGRQALRQTVLLLLPGEALRDSASTLADWVDANDHDADTCGHCRAVRAVRNTGKAMHGPPDTEPACSRCGRLAGGGRHADGSALCDDAVVDDLAEWERVILGVPET